MKIKNSRAYTLIELLVSMAVFMILMLILMQFFNSAQKIWTQTNAKVTMFEDARIALNLIARDLQCVCYNSDYNGPFYTTNRDTASVPNDRSTIAFVSKLPEKSKTSDGTANSRMAEISYWLDTTTSGEEHQLKRGVIGDQYSDYDWNDTSKAANVSLVQPTDSDAICTVIPYVTEFKINAYKDTLDTLDTLSGELDEITSNTEFPYAVSISISLLEKSAFKKWEAKGYDSNYKNENQRTFTKIVLLGNRGQL